MRFSFSVKGAEGLYEILIEVTNDPQMKLFKIDENIAKTIEPHIRQGASVPSWLTSKKPPFGGPCVARRRAALGEAGRQRHRLCLRRRTTIKTTTRAATAMMPKPIHITPSGIHTVNWKRSVPRAILCDIISRRFSAENQGECSRYINANVLEKSAKIF
jgi:hypothetical protein